jgi:type IV pilus assembly protein PilN
MRLDINLASHPYQDARSFYFRWVTALILVVLVTAAMVGFAIYEWRGTRDNARQLAQVRQQIAKLEAERQENEAILNRSENRGTRDRSQYLNALIARKSFSWTQVFSDLEKIMPARVHVLSITPELKEDRQIAIKMRVAGDSGEKTFELVRKMEQSRRFREPQVTNYTANPPSAGSGDNVQVEISALYVPDLRGE